MALFLSLRRSPFARRRRRSSTSHSRESKCKIKYALWVHQTALTMKKLRLKSKLKGMTLFLTRKHRRSLSRLSKQKSVR